MEPTKVLYPILDEFGQKTGETIDTTSASEGVRLGYVHIYVFNSKWQMLVQQRTPKARRRPNLIDPSAAGHVEPHLSPLESAVLELQEELGIHVAPTQLEPLFVDIGPKWWTQVYRLTYDGPITIAENEVARIAWHSLDEVRFLAETFPYLMSDGFVSSINLYFSMKKGV